MTTLNRFNSTSLRSIRIGRGWGGGFNWGIKVVVIYTIGAEFSMLMTDEKKKKNPVGELHLMISGRSWCNNIMIEYKNTKRICRRRWKRRRRGGGGGGGGERWNRFQLLQMVNSGRHATLWLADGGSWTIASERNRRRNATVMSHSESISIDVAIRWLAAAWIYFFFLSHHN